MSSVVISTAAADSTGSGGRVGVYGNVACLDKAGYPCTNIVIGAPVKISQRAYKVVFINPKQLNDDEIRRKLRQLLSEINPQLVWLHHYWIWDYFEPLALQYPFVLLSGDPDWELLHLKKQTKTRKGSIPARILHYLKFKARLRAAKKRESQVFRAADQHGGILACWCPSSVPTLAKRTQVEVHACPLAFPDWGKRATYQPESLLMLGNLNGGHTRNGLKFFMEQIWEGWNRLTQNTALPKIRMVGGGKMPKSITMPKNGEFFERVGFVEDLEAEWQNALATLVPVETELGFRTRIVESWSKGVPVIAHPSVETSLPEAKDGIHYLSFQDAEQLKTAVERLQDKSFYEQLVAAARQLFAEHYELDGAFQRFRHLSEAAILKKPSPVSATGNKAVPTPSDSDR